MAGGATFSPQLLVDGKRPLDKYPAAREVLLRAVHEHLAAPLFPLACTQVFWPVYLALVRRFKTWSEAKVFALGLFLSIGSTWSLSNLFYAFIERFGFFEQDKLDRQPHQLAKRKLVISTLLDALFSKTVAFPFLGWCLHGIFRWRGVPAMTAPRPSMLRIYRDLFVSYFLNKVLFYWSHRAFHSSLLYARVHKQHHEWNGPASIATEYSTPTEQLFANIIPATAGVFLLKSHPWTALVYTADRTRRVYEIHSGYALKLPVLNALGAMDWRHAAQHDFHHTKNCGNFAEGWCDWVWGTMDAYAVQGGDEGYGRSKSSEKLSYMRPQQLVESKA